MNFRELNHKKNFWLRNQKTRLALILFDKKNTNHFAPSSIKNIKKILFLRHDNKLGDMVVSTTFYKNLKKLLPTAQISVIAGNTTKQIIENNKNITTIYTLKKSWLDTIKLGLKLRKEKFDLVIDIDEQLLAQTILLLRLINARFVFGFNKKDIGIYNIKKDYVYGKEHISHIYKKVLEGIKLIPQNYKFDFSYSVYLTKESINLAKITLKNLSKMGLQNNKSLVIFNPFAASKHRCLSALQAVEVAQKLDKYNFLVIGPENKLKYFLPNNNYKPNNLFLLPLELAKKGGVKLNMALLKQADYLISPDTYIVHIASAFDKPQLSLYFGKDKNNIIQWKPNSDKAYILEVPGNDMRFVESKLIVDNFIKLTSLSTKNNK